MSKRTTLTAWSEPSCMLGIVSRYKQSPTFADYRVAAVSFSSQAPVADDNFVAFSFASPGQRSSYDAVSLRVAVYGGQPGPVARCAEVGSPWETFQIVIRAASNRAW